MTKQDFINSLEEDCQDSKNISFSITTAKGLITLFWSTTFLEQNHQEAFDEFYDEIQWANMKLDYLEKKHSDIHIYTRKLTDVDARHFDHIVSTTKKTPVKKAYDTDTLSMGGFIQFKNIK